METLHDPPQAEDVGILHQRSRISDVIAWTFAVPLPFLSLVCLRIPSVIHNFRHMFDQLHATLPAVTILILETPAIVWILLPMIVTAIVFWTLLGDRQQPLKAIVAIVGAGIVVGEIGMVVLGIWYPIVELQKLAR